MINDSNHYTNNKNYLKDYIEYHFNKEKNKFSRLKYKLHSINNKKISQITTLYNTIVSNNNRFLPFINKNQIQKEYNNNLYSNSNKYLNSIKTDSKYEEHIDFDELKTKNFRNFRGLLSDYNHNNNEMNKIQNSNYDINSLTNSQRDYLTININNTNEINSYRIKEINSIDKIEKVEPKKSNKKILKNIKKLLDKEIVNSPIRPRRRSNLFNKGSEEIKKRLKIIKSEIKAKKEKEEAKIIDTLYIGNNIINNCKMKEKIIYDIRPLNKTKEKASCHFPSNEYPKTTKIQLNNRPKINPNIIIKKNNTNCITQKHLKYFRNSYSQFYSTNTNFNDNTNKNDNEYKTIKYDFSEKELINMLFIDNDNENNDEIKKDYNNYINKVKKKYFSETKNSSSMKQDNFIKNNLDYIDLSVLAKEIPDTKRKTRKLRSFYGNKDENVVRGEKIKFLKTCNQVQFVKPLLSQKAYEFKTSNSTKKIFAPKRKKFPVNHFNLDILRNKNIKAINNTENHLYDIKQNMKKHLKNVVDYLDKEIIYK